MITYTTCATCRGIMELPLQGTDPIRAPHHPDCAQPPVDPYEHGLQLFATMVHWMLSNTPTPEQEAKFDKLRLWLEAKEDETPKLKAAALTYISWGWQVFPLSPKDKTPAIDHWRDNASTDPDVVAQWWTDMPDANIGLPTGLMFDVLDFDNMESKERIERDGRVASFEKRGIHGVVRTSRGGEHWYLPVSGDGNKANVFGKIGYPGIDYRGIGGYVVAPPSWLEPGRRWTWVSKPSPEVRRAVEVVTN